MSIDFLFRFIQHRVKLQNLVEPLRLFHPTRVDGGVRIFIGFLFRFIQHRVKL